MKILICGYNLYGYLDSIKKAFLKAGCETDLFLHRNVSIRKLEQKNPIKKIWAWIRLKHINSSLKSYVLEYKPDITLCINASSIFPETASFISKNSYSILWLVDSLERVSTDLKTIDQFKKIFVFEPKDMEKLKDSEYLPYGFDEEIYFKTNEERRYEVSFVGSGHRERYEILNFIAEGCKYIGKKLNVFGPFSLFKKDPSHKKSYPFLYESLVYNRRLSPKEINRIYNQSWINLNIHHPQSKEGVNPRTFEIAGSGNFQLVERKLRLLELFDVEKEVATYRNIGELIEKIKYFLKEKKSLLSISEMGRKRAISEHTFLHRARFILNAI